MLDVTKIHVGTTLKLKKSVLSASPGDTGTCIHVDGDVSMFIFKNGNFDGFSIEDVNKYFDEASIDFNQRLADYKFVNVIRLDWDFNSGVFI